MWAASSSSPWECEPPCPTWDWLLQTLGEGPALSVSIGLLGHWEAQSSVRICCDCQPGLSKYVDFLAFFFPFRVLLHRGDWCRGNPVEDAEGLDWG